MKYNIHLIDESDRFGGHDIAIVEAETALKAVEHGRVADLMRNGHTGVIDTREWKATAHGGQSPDWKEDCATLAPSEAQDQWGGTLVIAADPIEE